jgi:hypothetical protein
VHIVDRVNVLLLSSLLIVMQLKWHITIVIL